jgi:hypothetical protein
MRWTEKELPKASSGLQIPIVLHNVFHHHPGQPITLVNFPWRDQLLLCIFNFIAIKQGTYVRRALI